jgi:AraC-like DNA-binding protein
MTMNQHGRTVNQPLTWEDVKNRRSAAYHGHPLDTENFHARRRVAPGVSFSGQIRQRFVHAAYRVVAGILDRVSRVSITRTETPLGWSEFALSRLDNGPIARFCGYRERSANVVARTMPAGSLVPLIISFGDSLELDYPDDRAERLESFVAGLHPGPATTRFQGGQFGLQVDLTPLGAFQVLGVPGGEFAHQAVPLDALLPRLGAGLADRLASARTWAERFALVEQTLLTRCVDNPEPDPMVTWLWHELEASNGRASIATLVAETGRSHRHVTTRFAQQVGLTPKAAASLLRFEHAARTIARLPLADAALASGYADQSHLTREFVRHAGAPPAAWLARLDPATVDFVQDPSTAAT